MAALDAFGFEPVVVEAHRKQASAESFTPRYFFETATYVLDEINPAVIREVLPNLETLPGRWHPQGFIVYHLGVNAELGTLRLHIWPKAHRVYAQQTPGIHDHAWYLCSRVVAGQYSDELFEVKNIEDVEDNDSEEYMLVPAFSAHYSSGQPDRLLRVGELTVRTTSKRVFETGKTHTINAGVFHRTTVPEEELAATLVLDSFALGFAPRVLINTDKDSIDLYRQQVTEDEAIYAKHQIEEFLATAST